MIKRTVGALKALANRKSWGIGIYDGTDPLSLTTHVSNPVLTYKDVTDVRAEFVADPFVIFAKDGTCHMFFEVLNSKTGRGEIGVAYSVDHLTWHYDKIVLAEPFHLSYPFVFAEDENYYMIPESSQDNSIRLYIATKFPTDWRFCGELLSGAPFKDNTLVRRDSTYYLFTYVGTGLHVYFATDLRGPWEAHPQNPVAAGDHARPGGRMVNFQDRLLRMCQDTGDYYGKALVAGEILILNKEVYAEREIGEIVRRGTGGWNALGMHHVDAQAHPDAPGWIAVADGLSLIRDYRPDVLFYRTLRGIYKLTSKKA